MWLCAETAVLLLLLHGITIHALVDPLTAVASSLTVAGVSLLYKPIYCQFSECCDSKWLHTTAPSMLPLLHKIIMLIKKNRISQVTINKPGY